MISVVVPTRGDAGKLATLLGALEAQTLPRERFELLLALDGGQLAPALAARVAALGGRVAQLAERRGPGAARNAGAALARGDWLAFTEDDVTPAPDWLERAAAVMAASPAPDAFEGVTTRPGDRPLRTGLDVGLQYLPTNLFVRRDWFTRVGGYEEAYYEPARGTYFREDSDLGFKLEEARAVCVRAADVRVTHPDEHPGPWDPLRWAARYEMDPLLARRHPRLFAERIEVHRVGPFRLSRVIARACTGILAALACAGAAAVLGNVLGMRLLLALAGALYLLLWSKWRFSPVHLPATLLVPVVMAVALLRGSVRAARIESRRREARGAA